MHHKSQITSHHKQPLQIDPTIHITMQHTTLRITQHCATNTIPHNTTQHHANGLIRLCGCAKNIRYVVVAPSLFVTSNPTLHGWANGLITLCGCHNSLRYEVAPPLPTIVTSNPTQHHPTSPKSNNGDKRRKYHAKHLTTQHKTPCKTHNNSGEQWKYVDFCQKIHTHITKI